MSTRQLDVGVVELPLFRSAIAIEPLDPVQFTAVMPADHRPAGKEVVSLKDLDGERMVSWHARASSVTRSTTSWPSWV